MRISRFVLIVFLIASVIYGQSVILRGGKHGRVVYAPASSGGEPPPPPTDSIGAEWWNENGSMAGYPIGGGPGYADSFTVSSGNGSTHYYVSTYAHFNAVLTDSVDPGDTVYVADNATIDFGTNEYIIYGSAVGGDCDSITICSGRGRTLGDTISWGGVLYTNNPANDQMIRCYANGVRFSGLRFRGYMPYYYSNYSDAYPNFRMLQIYDSSVTVDNCEFSYCGYAAIAPGENAVACTVRYNYIHHNKERGNGYGVACDLDAEVFVQANLFDFYRHAVTASVGFTGYYTASYNICQEHDAEWPTFDLHIPGQGAEIHHNTWMSWQQNGNRVMGFGMGSGTPSESLLIHHNWSYHNDSTETFSLSTQTNVRISEMHYGRSLPEGLSNVFPIANGQIDTDSGDVPLTVNLKDEQSEDNDGFINWYEWDLGIGDATPRVRAESTQCTYTKIGQYHPRLYVYDNSGIPDYDEFTIKVVPAGTKQDSVWLSFWYLDSYSGIALSGYLQAQALVNNDTIWLQDLNGDSVWQHIVLNVTGEVGANDSADIEFRLVYKQNFPGTIDDLHTFWDDIWMWNGTVRNGDFELDATAINTSPTYWTAGHVSAGGGYFGFYNSTADVVSGQMSWMMKTTEFSTAPANDYCYLRQRVDVLGQ